MPLIFKAKKGKTYQENSQGSSKDGVELLVKASKDRDHDPRTRFKIILPARMDEDGLMRLLC
jgi:hypothetical protein